MNCLSYNNIKQYIYCNKLWHLIVRQVPCDQFRPFWKNQVTGRELQPEISPSVACRAYQWDYIVTNNSMICLVHSIQLRCEVAFSMIDIHRNLDG